MSAMFVLARTSSMSLERMRPAMPRV